MSEQTELNRIEAKLDKALYMIYGNGEPEKGMLWRISKLEGGATNWRKRQQWMASIVSSLIVAILAIAAQVAIVGKI